MIMIYLDNYIFYLLHYVSPLGHRCISDTYAPWSVKPLHLYRQ